jgi:hypothetical protein
MKYIDTELLFTETKDPGTTTNRSFNKEHGFQNQEKTDTEVLGVKVRMANNPLVYNLRDFSRKGNKEIFENASSESEHYLIVHAISAIRTSGNAKVEELSYTATSSEPEKLQTVGLIPETKFNEKLRADLDFMGAIGISGEASLSIPAVVMSNLLQEFIDIAPGLKLQLSTALGFVGKFTYSFKTPIIQSAGIGSNSCTWILKPDENKTPLLGDQLLVQSVRVPLGSKRIIYKISGSIIADKGILWKQQEKKTPEYEIEVKL